MEPVPLRGACSRRPSRRQSWNRFQKNARLCHHGDTLSIGAATQRGTRAGEGPRLSSRRARALANDQRHRVMDGCSLLCRRDRREQTTTGITSHLPHRLRHRRQTRPRPRPSGIHRIPPPTDRLEPRSLAAARRAIKPIARASLPSTTAVGRTGCLRNAAANTAPSSAS